MTPFISIIIPFYGTADPVLLQRCITSIREQGMEEGSYEIIVADDESQTRGEHVIVECNKRMVNIFFL